MASSSVTDAFNNGHNDHGGKKWYHHAPTVAGRFSEMQDLIRLIR